MTTLAGQKPVLAKSRKAIANFKLKQGQIVGCHVTLRGPAMWEFLLRLLAVALPTIRDFRGISPKLDGQGNYTIGITDHTIFPEITVDNVKKHIGLDITIVTSAETDDEARDLLRLLGMPFRRAESPAKPAPTPAPKAAYPADRRNPTPPEGLHSTSPFTLDPSRPCPRPPPSSATRNAVASSRNSRPSGPS